MTLTEFLLSRIAEDEATARRETAPLYDDSDFAWSDDEPMFPVLMVDPARILAECQSKRRIITEHSSDVMSSLNAYGNKVETVWCRTCHVPGDSTDGRWCLTLRALVLPYVDHPDYDEAWRP